MMKPETQAARFWSKVDKRGPDECWPWTGCTTGGYGCCGLGLTGGRWQGAHRFSWQLHHGPLVGDIQVLHRCDNPPCVNPAHLFLGTHADNMRDKAVKGRVRGGGMGGSSPGEANPSAKLDRLSVDCLRVVASLKVFSQIQLAKWWGISQQQASNIVRGASWT